MLSLGPGNQPSGVVVSGSDVDEEVTFPAITPPSPATVQFDVTNDDIAREPNEVYSLSLSTTTTGVSVGDATTITITDDDGKIHNNTTASFLHSPCSRFIIPAWVIYICDNFLTSLF